MDIFTLVFVSLLALVFTNSTAQRKRLRFLAGYLRPYQIEQLLERLLNGYLRALDEPDLERARGIWANLYDAEKRLANQVGQLANALEKADPKPPRMASVPFQACLANYLPSSFTVDVAALIRIHAQGLATCAEHPQDEAPEARKRRAFAMSAEMLLMQHTCHWFCRSRGMASARLMAQHQTQYGQVVDSVLPATRTAYQQAVGASARA